MRTLLLILLVSLVALVPGEASRRRLLLEKANEREQSAGGGAVDNTLIVRYKFDEGSGGDVFDTTSTHNDATLSGSPTWITGKSGSGGAIRFNGTSQYLKSISSITYGANVITICAWVKAATWPAGASTYNVFESSANYIVPDGAFLVASDFSTLQTFFSGDSFTEVHEYNSPDPTDATWVHLTFILNNSTANGDIEVYYDGVLQTEVVQTGSKTGTQNFTAQILNIASRDGSSRFAAIDVDDFCIFSGALSQTEIEYVRDNPDR